MDKIIKKYGLILEGNPIPVSLSIIKSLDEVIDHEPFRIHSYPFPSYDSMFPLDNELPPSFNLCFFSSQSPIVWTSDLLKDLKEESSVFLVGVQGIILLGQQHPDKIGNKCYLSPAYYFPEDRAMNHKSDEAQIPYFTKNKEGIISVGYSRTAASALPAHREPLLLGTK